MSFINNILQVFVGTKAQHDLSEVQPVVESIKAVYQDIVNLTNDELRNRSSELKIKIREYIRPDEEEINALKSKGESDDTPVDEIETIYTQVDKLEKELDKKIEQILNEILPEAFSIVKETARRFKENGRVVVTANDFDRDQAATKDSVLIEGDKAIYLNHWMAGGNEITWDMVHYDVQLFGGVVLHQGKIAEMATGAGKTLVATLPVFLNALAGKGVHIVTVNDYLAKRDSEWMGPIYE